MPTGNGSISIHYLPTGRLHEGVQNERIGVWLSRQLWARSIGDGALTWREPAGRRPDHSADVDESLRGTQGEVHLWMSLHGGLGGRSACG